MANNRRKGKDGELWFAQKLKSIFPDIHRNWKEQSAVGGIDLEGTDPFNFECKSGKKYTLKKNQDMISQVRSEGKQENWDVVLVRPHDIGKNEPFALIPLDDFLEILEVMKAEGIL